SVDVAGNVESVKSETIKIDKTAPVLAGLNNITAQLQSFSGAVVTYNPTASDATSGIVSFSVTPGSGSTFGPGTTTVTVKATDEAGNTTTGTFTVTVLHVGVDASGNLLILGTNGADNITTSSCGNKVTVTGTDKDGTYTVTGRIIAYLGD